MTQQQDSRFTVIPYPRSVLCIFVGVGLCVAFTAGYLFGHP